MDSSYLNYRSYFHTSISILRRSNGTGHTASRSICRVNWLPTHARDAHLGPRTTSRRSTVAARKRKVLDSLFLSPNFLVSIPWKVAHLNVNNTQGAFEEFIRSVVHQGEYRHRNFKKLFHILENRRTAKRWIHLYYLLLPHFSQFLLDRMRIISANDLANLVLKYFGDHNLKPLERVSAVFDNLNN